MTIDQYELSNLNKEKKIKRRKTMNRALSTCGTIPKSLTFSLSDFRRREKRVWCKNFIEEATSLVVQWLRLWVEGTCLIPGQGTRILCGASKINLFKISFEEIMGKYFSDLVRDINLCIQKSLCESQIGKTHRNTHRDTP